jgi:hypothetical protein
VNTGSVEDVPRVFELAGAIADGEADRRHLEREFADVATYENLRDQGIDAAFLRGCGSMDSGDLYGQPSFNFYCLGTVAARALWDGSGRDITVLREEMMPAVIEAMHALGEHLVDDPMFDVDFFLAPVAEGVSATRRSTTLCPALVEKFGSIVAAGRIPACL